MSDKLFLLFAKDLTYFWDLFVTVLGTRVALIFENNSQV